MATAKTHDILPQSTRRGRWWSPFARWTQRWRLPVSGEDPTRVVPRYEILEKKVGRHFEDPRLLVQAMTHRSHVHVSGMERIEANERLEFLGDSVLGMLVNEYLFDRFVDKEEGDLTKMKSLLVCGTTLAKVGYRLGLGEHLLLSRAEAGTGGRKRESILADVTEAVLGALYLDGGMDAARQFVVRNILVNVNGSIDEQTHRNYKSQLQETLQAKYKTPPRYKVTYTTGPDHARRFTVKVTLRGQILGVGSGSSKKQAEQRAAESALARLEELPSLSDPAAS
jgi:ribonuclease III